jgi:hypothetical protein
MKPLNRPMFRYGGPIKEGVMSGIREPKKDGGLSKQFNTGLVGDERYPKTDGREHHVAFIPPIMAGLGIAGRALARPFGKFVMRQMAGPVKKSTPIKNLNLNLKGTPIKGGLQVEKFSPNPIGNYFLKSPEAGLVSAIAKGTGKIAGPVKRVATAGVKSPLTVGGGLLYIGGKFFNKDGTPASADAIAKSKASDGGPPGGGDPSMFATPKETSIPQLTAEELKKERIQKYRDIMDIKGMNKDAAYNSLIAASQAINESGDFKGDIKSGKLINQIIQATSKQFDKPKATKDAIDTLILKGEIEKDIKASDPSNAQLNALRDLQGKKLKKELNPSFNTLKAGFAKDNKGQSGIDLAAGTYAANNGIDFKGNIISKSEFNDILKDLKAKTKGLDEDLIIKNYTEEIIKTQEAPDGAYTVGDKIVIIQDKQVIAVE